MKAEQIEVLKRIAEAATPGPWSVDRYDCGDKPYWAGTPSVQAPEELDCAIVHWAGFAQEYWRSARGDAEIQANAAHIAAFDPPTVLALLSELASLRSEREGMREGLKVAAQRFRFYEKLHAAKGTPDADAKAQNNADMAAMLEALLLQGEEK